MALAVRTVGGNASTGTDFLNAASFTSLAGSLIVVIGHYFNTVGAAANGDVTDNKGNTYTLITSLLGGASAVGVAMYYNNNGVRGASHLITVNGPGSGDSVNVAVIEITGQDLVSALDATTFATANDKTTPFAVASAAAIGGNQIAVYGCTTNCTTNTAWTQPTGYTNIINQPNGAALLQSIASYKLLETGTPSPAAANAGTITDAREIFATFKEATATTKAPPFQPRTARHALLRR